MTDKTEVTRPEPLLSSSDYIEDFKVRWQIHSYECEKLREDIKTSYEVVSPYLEKAKRFISESFVSLKTRLEN